MDYIVFDLEWNQNPNGKKGHADPLPFEILEIGAVKLNEKKEIVGDFRARIRPQVYRRMHYQIRKMLGRDLSYYQDGTPFPEAAERFLDWCGEDYRFCTWGPSDLPELQRNLLYYGMELPCAYPLYFYDVQKLFGIANGSRGLQRTLEYAVDFLSLKKDEDFHEAAGDALYTARVLQTLETALIRANYSIDCFRLPRTPQEEIYAVYDSYSKYISRRFDTREHAMSDREVTSTRCYLCGKPARKKIRWFAASSRLYFCQCCCERHGWMNGKIQIKPTADGGVYVIKLLKLVSAADAAIIKQKQDAVRRKRRRRRIQNKEKVT